jgi:hypothetical protein
MAENCLILVGFTIPRNAVGESTPLLILTKKMLRIFISAKFTAKICEPTIEIPVSMKNYDKN